MVFFEAPGFAFFTGFELVPTAGRQITAQAIWMSASGNNDFSRVGTGSATRAGNRR
jgi:hypothetical protein